MELFHVNTGSVVVSGHQTMIVLWSEENEVIACPVIYADEAFHRSDNVLEWHELVDAGLTRLDVRCRAIPCRRRIGSLKEIGRVGESTVQRLRSIARNEQKNRLVEMPYRDQATKPSGRTGKMRAVWFDGGSMKSRREESHLMG